MAANGPTTRTDCVNYTTVESGNMVIRRFAFRAAITMRGRPMKLATTLRIAALSKHVAERILTDVVIVAVELLNGRSVMVPKVNENLSWVRSA